MDNKTEQMTESPQFSQKEIQKVPQIRQLTRANLLSMYWDKPISSFTSNGETLPGIQKDKLPEDRSQTFGHYLSGGKFQTFADLKNALADINFSDIKPVLEKYRELCPSPRELFEQNRDLLNWVPWEAYIAYGDVLESRRTDENLEDVQAEIKSITSGNEYLIALKEKFPEGFPRKRTEIVLSRQNKDPKTQGILEGVSNSIDAISKREKIGQFGLGAKQLFEWLQIGSGELSVVTRSAGNEALAIRVRKGADGQVYIKYSPPTPEEQAQFEQEKTGTAITVSGIEIDADKREDITSRLRQRFRYVPETEIDVNGEKINGFRKFKVVGRNTPVEQKGEIQVAINENGFSIKDNGTGMDRDILFRMFLPGHGKGYKPISPSEAEKIALEQAEVLFIEDDQPRIVFSRNREADFSIEVPENRTNTSSKTICLELGRILKVSEGRDGFEIDENFSTAVSILVEKTLKDEELTDNEKTTFLNSLVLGIDQLSSMSESDQEDKTAVIVRKTKSGIRKASVSYLRQLRDKNITLLPNYSVYQKINADCEFVDPYLLEGISGLDVLLQSEGIMRLKSEDGIQTRRGWKVFAAQMKEADEPRDLFARIKDAKDLRQVRVELQDLLPVVLDKVHRIAVIDSRVWSAIDAEADPAKKAYLQESVQAIINDKVLTSYEAEDPRSVYLKEKVESSEAVTKTETKLLGGEESLLNEPCFAQSIQWISGDTLYAVDPGGVFRKYDSKTRQCIDTVFVKSLKDKEFISFTLTENGVWIYDQVGQLLQLDSHGNELQKFQTPQFLAYGYSTSISQDGKIITLRDTLDLTGMSRKSKIIVIDPHTSGTTEYDLGQLKNLDHEISSPYVTSSGDIFFKRGNLIYKYDPRNNKLISSGEDALGGGKPSYGAKENQFIESNGKLYMVGLSYNTLNNHSLCIFEISEADGKITAKPISEFADPYRDIGKVVGYTDPASGKMGLVESGEHFIFTPDDSGVSTEGYYKRVNYAKKETGAALNKLRELFGDDDAETSYSEAVIALRGRLLEPSIGNPITIDAVSVESLEPPKDNENIKLAEILRLENENNPKNDNEKSLKDLQKKILESKFFDSNKNPVGPELAGLKVPTSARTSEGSINERVLRLLSILESSQLREVFNPVWSTLKDTENIEDLQRLKMRFVRNAPVLLDIDPASITKEGVEFLFLSDNPQNLLEQTQEQRQKLTKFISTADTLSQKEGLLEIAEILTRKKSPADLEIFYSQAEKIFNRERYRESFLRAISQNKDKLIQACIAPQELPITDPLRSFILFLSNQSEMIRVKEEMVNTDGYRDILPPNVPLELLAHFRLGEGLLSAEEMNEAVAQVGGVDAYLKKINVSHYQDEIRKAIHAQATEAGVDKRELLQNALDAIRKNGGSEGKIVIDFYLRNGGQEFIEEIKDNGIGIENIIAFLVPGVTTKEGTGGQGFFGTGFYKNFEDADSIEVDTVTEENGQKKATRITIQITKDQEGTVQGGIVSKVQTKQDEVEEDTGTKICFVRKVSDRLPELETMIAKNTYMSMGGLATYRDHSGVNAGIFFINEDGQEWPALFQKNDMSNYELEGIGNIKFVYIPGLASYAASGGLRMSSLYGSSSDYLQDVPPALKSFFADERISMALPGSLPLVKDRSRLAYEEKYIDLIRRTVATETLKRAAIFILSERNIKISGFVPEDILTNSDYYSMLTSDAGKQAYGIAQKINQGKVLDENDLAYLNKENEIEPLIMVLMGIEKTTFDDKKDSLLRRFQYIQEKAGNAAISSGIGTSLGVEASMTAVTPQILKVQDRLMGQAQLFMKTRTFINSLEREISQGRKPEQVQTLSESGLEQTEKDILTQFFSKLGFEEVFFVPEDEHQAEGSFNGKRLYINSGVLRKNIRERWEVFNHELSHLFEMRAMGLESGLLDTEEQKESEFTHQQEEGSFADYYKLAAALMIDQRTH